MGKNISELVLEQMGQKVLVESSCILSKHTIKTIILGLSIAGLGVLFGILVPIAIILFIVLLINILQSKRPEWLPERLKNWDFLPLWMHSLDPLDKVIRRIGTACCCGRKCQCLNVDENEMDSLNTNTHRNSNGNDNYALDMENDKK